jgi:hypothetical protein
MKLLGANRLARHHASDLQPGRSNYFLGDRSRWRTDVPHYGRIEYEDVFPGITAVYHGTTQALEYDFVVAPGAEPGKIRLSFDGTKSVRIDENGDLVLDTGTGEVRHRKPVLYQEIDGKRHLRAGRYVMRGRNEVGFLALDYDRKRPLVIDPVLQFSSYFGTTSNEVAYGLALDPSGNAYISGTAFLSSGPNQPPIHGPTDAFIAKISAAGTLVYSTYIGGSDVDSGASLGVDSAGNAYLTGRTRSLDFPTVNAFQPTYGGGDDAFVVELNSAGNGLVYSTYLGGSAFEYGNGLAVDAAGYTYIAAISASTNFPIVNAVQNHNAGGHDAIAVKIAPGGSVVYATYLGGSSSDFANGLTIDSLGNAYIFGDTSSSDLPVLNAIQPTYSGKTDVFLAKLDPNGALLYFTYIGGSGDDAARSGKVDAAGNLYFCGETSSTNFPTVNPIQGFGGDLDMFLIGLNPTGSAMLFSTYIGGSAKELANSMGRDPQGNLYIGGSTFSTDFPTVNALQSSNAGDFDVTLTKIDPSGSTILFSTYLGGSGFDQSYKVAVDAAGNAWLTGQTLSTNFPLVSPFQSTLGGAGDVFVAKIATCSVALSPSSNLFDSGGGSGTLTATTLAGCNWTLTSDSPWVTFTTSTSGVGSGSVGYLVAPNLSKIPRTTFVRAGDQSATVLQSGSAVTLTSISPNSGNTGASVAVTLTGNNFSPGSTVSAGPGISISNVNVVSPTQMTATMAIAPNAPAGLVGVSVTDASGDSNSVGFTVASQFQLRIDAGSSVPYTDPAGVTWGPDSNFTGGGPVVNSSPVSGTPTPALYDTAHFGPVSGTPLTYQFAVPNGSYIVNLKFDENSFNQPGLRVFNVVINGQTVLPNFDIFARAGALYQAVDAAVPVTVTNGQISIAFVAILRNPRICAIEILSATSPPPSLASISPASGSPGAVVPVTITGANFDTDLVINAGAAIAVTNVSVVSPSQLNATFTIAPNAVLGSANVVVTSPGGASSPFVFTLGSTSPSIASVSPSSGLQGAVVPVTITGSNFLAGATVAVSNPGITVSNVVIGSGTQITATLTIAANAALGSAGITVTTSNGVSSPASFTVAPPPPGLSSMTPSSGVQASSVPVTLNGSNFVPGAIVAVSNPGITVSNVNVVNSAQITATFTIAANAAVGSANVTVTTSGGASPSITFTTNAAPPALVSITPSTGVIGSSFSVSLSGSSFLAGATVATTSPSITVSNVNVVNSSQITATFAIAANATPGNFNVTVTTSAGTTGSVSFSITAAPVFTPIRIDAGSSVPYTDPAGITWGPDSNSNNLGGPVVNSSPVSGTPTPALYDTARFGPVSGTPLTYQFAVPNGSYIVNLKFDENSFNQPGLRVFNVVINGQTVLPNFDIFARAGALYQAVDAAVPVTVTNGQIAIAFGYVQRNPRICAIEILSATAAPPSLASISPASGSPGAVVPVTITGSNFDTDLVINAGAGIAVTNVAVVSPSQLNATFTIAPNAALGSANVIVSSPGGTTTPLTFTIQ